MPAVKKGKPKDIVNDTRRSSKDDPDVIESKPTEADLEKLKQIFGEEPAEGETASELSQLMDLLDTRDKANAYIVASFLTSDINKIKHITELGGEMISSLSIVGATSEYMRTKGIESAVRDNLYSEVLTLMVSKDRKGRKELVEAVRSGVDDLKNAIMTTKSRFGAFQ